MKKYYLIVTPLWLLSLPIWLYVASTTGVSPLYFWALTNSSLLFAAMTAPPILKMAEDA